MKNNKTPFAEALQPLGSVMLNLCTLAVVYQVLRIVFYLCNRSFFAGTDWSGMSLLCLHSIRFDLTAVTYLALPYILLALLPFPFRSKRWYSAVTRGFYLLGAALGLFANLCDTAYFPFTLHRTTTRFFHEFSGDGHVDNVILQSLFSYWYLTLCFVILMLAVYFLYRPVKTSEQPASKSAYYLTHSLMLLVGIVLSLFTIRGLRWTGYPLGIHDAVRYCEINEQALVLNTPFTLIRTIGHDNRKTLERVEYYSDEAALEAVFTPVQHAPSADSVRTDNVVILLLESFSKEFTGFFNPKNKANQGGYTPFLDSLLSVGYTFRYSFADGKKSVESIPAVLAGIPMIVNLNESRAYADGSIESIATHLEKRGYRSSFFHNSSRSTLGIFHYVMQLGFDQYFALEDYPDQSKFDGTWGIWDEEFFEYFAQHLDTLRQPFVSGIFTTSSHHPFVVPEKYRGVYPEGPRPMHHCIAYTDDSMRKFFHRVQHAPWFKNTLFVILADHTSELAEASSINARGLFEIPILFYHPSDPNLHGVDSTHVVQQTDILPSILGYLNDPTPCLAFGGNIFAPREKTFAFNYFDPVWQLYQDGWLLQFDGERTVGFYDYVHDTYMKQNLVDTRPEQADMERLIKALIQQYMNRVSDNRLTAE